MLALAGALSAASDEHVCPASATGGSLGCLAARLDNSWQAQLRPEGADAASLAVAHAARDGGAAYRRILEFSDNGSLETRVTKNLFLLFWVRPAKTTGPRPPQVRENHR